jgi:hypothetical protein
MPNFSENLTQHIANYLRSKPYAEVADLLSIMQAEYDASKKIEAAAKETAALPAPPTATAVPVPDTSPAA